VKQIVALIDAKTLAEPTAAEAAPVKPEDDEA